MLAAVDYPVLRRPRITAGVGAKTASMIWSLCAVAALSVGLPWGLVFVPITAVIHKAISWFFRIDHRIVDIYLLYETVPNDLKAGLPCHGERFDSRPAGYAKGVSL